MEYAAHAYCGSYFQSEDDLLKDYNIVIMIKRLMFKYYRGGDLKAHLTINYLKTFFNLFGDKGVNILFLEIDDELYCILKTFLTYLDRMPEIIEFNHYQIFSSGLSEDEKIKQALSEI